MSESVSYSEPEYTSIEYPLKIRRTARNMTALVSEIPNAINEENAFIVSGYGNKNLRDEFKSMVIYI